MKKIILIIIILLLGIFLYGHYIEINNFKTHEYTIKAEVPTSFKELKIIQISDILYESKKENLDNIVDKINELDADIIFFTGDLFKKNQNYTEDDYTYLKKSLNNMKANYYKYAIIGDNDKNNLEKYKSIINEANFKLLDNESTLFFYKDMTPINIIGIQNNVNLDELLTKDVSYDVALVLTHEPDTVTKINDARVKAVFAGHSLGGTINIPFYGGLIKKTGAKTYVNNYYVINNLELFISNGIGNEGFNFRLLNTPSINIYRFN